MVVVLFALERQRHRKHQRIQERLTINRAWKQAAKQLDGVLRLSDRDESRVLVATVDGVEVTVEHHKSRSSKSDEDDTRLLAVARAPEGLELRVDRATAGAVVARSLGSQDVATGDRAFDNMFVVKSNTPSVVSVWLNAAVRRRISIADAYWFTLADGEVRVGRTGMERQAEDLVDAVRATAAFADGRQRVLRVWKAVADSLDGGDARKVQGGWVSVEGMLAGVVVHMGTRVFKGEHYTYVRAHNAGAKRACFSLGRAQQLSDQQLPPATIDSLAGTELRTNEVEEVDQRLDSATLTLMDSLGPELVDACEKHVTVSLLGVETGERTIRSMLELATSLAAPEGRGPYR